MKVFQIILYIIALCSLSVSQTVVLEDDFEDGDLAGWTSSGTGEWDASDISPISDTYSVKHMLSDSTGNSYIYQNLPAMDINSGSTIWQFKLKNGSWEPSDSAKFWVYVSISGINGNGYSVGVNKGDTSDTLRFNRITNGELDSILISSCFVWGTDDIVDIKIIRDSLGTWELYHDTTAMMNQMQYCGQAFDDTYTDGTGFALVYHFTRESAGTLWMDDILISKISGISVPAKVFLEGPYSGGSMSTSLRTDGYLPLAQPYNSSPWNYSGTEHVSSIPPDVVDWVLIELRTSVSASASIDSSAGFLLSDGSVVDTSGTRTLFFSSSDSGNYYIVVHHRNHLSIMSAQEVRLTTTTTTYDFTSSVDQTYGSNAQNQLDTGVYGMYTGDANANGQIQNDDKNDLWRPQSGAAGYHSGDFNLNGQVQNDDKNDYWRNNVGLGTNVPQ